MENSELMYKQLRDLFSGKEPKRDSISKGIATEKIVNSLVSDVVSPFKQELDVTVGKNEFDGEVQIGKGKTILYEIQLGTPARYVYNRILEIVKSRYFTKKTYILIIAQSFMHEDKLRIEELCERIRPNKTAVRFIDFETLIALHKFSHKIEKPDPRDTRTLKRLFFEKLFEGRPIITEELFSNALSFAEEAYPLEISVGSAARLQIVTIREEYEERIRRLEQMAQELLGEIRALRMDLHNRGAENK
jgi:hypothetical protein